MTNPNLSRKERRGILVGMLLGDGALIKAPGVKRYHIKLTHSTKQLAYIRHKKRLLEKITNASIPLHFLKAKAGGKTYPAATCRTKSDAEFSILRKLLYRDGKRKVSRSALDCLTPEGIAIWWMDDGNHNQVFRESGSLRQRQLTFCICRPEDEAEEVRRYFDETWGIQWGLVKYKRSTSDLKMLRVGAREGAKFCDLIEPYVIPSMRYKLLREYQAA